MAYQLINQNDCPSRQSQETSLHFNPNNCPIEILLPRYISCILLKSWLTRYKKTKIEEKMLQWKSDGSLRLLSAILENRKKNKRKSTNIIWTNQRKTRIEKEKKENNLREIASN